LKYQAEDTVISHLLDDLGWKRLTVHVDAKINEIQESLERDGFISDSGDVAKLNYKLGQLKALRDIIGIPDEVRKLMSSTP
tara:strand:+ start:769 stop:1011 length:243 start_codon:yes stop_codon:yes gene_type:complete